MIENCQISEIGLWFEGHGVSSLRIELSCNCSFHIELSKINFFMRDFLPCFDGWFAGNFYIKNLKGKYLRAHFDDNEKLIGFSHIIEDYGFDLTKYY